jgi:hypothetical protein
MRKRDSSIAVPFWRKGARLGMSLRSEAIFTDGFQCAISTMDARTTALDCEEVASLINEDGVIPIRPAAP